MFTKIKFFATVFCLVILSACAKSIYAPSTAVQQYAHVGSDRPYIELITMINNRTGQGGHSSLVVNGGSYHIMYDPAGRWYSSVAPERNDVLYGLKPAVMQRYKSFHSRKTHHVVTQRKYVSRATAQIAYKVALEQGASHDSMCSRNVSAMLKKIPGFETIGHHWFPAGLMRKFGKIPNVITDKYYEDDEGQN